MGLPALVRGVRGSGAFGPPWGTILAIGLGEIAPFISGGLEAHRCSASPLDKSSILPPRKRACHMPSAKVGYHCLVAVHLRAVLRAAGVSSCAHRPELLKAARSFNLSPFMDGDDCVSGSSNTAVAEHSECDSTQGQSASCGRDAKVITVSRTSAASDGIVRSSNHPNDLAAPPRAHTLEMGLKL